MADPTFLNPISILASIGGVSIDITQKVTENYPTIITENAIEDGSPTTDHITNQPPRLQIQGGFSDLKVTNLVGTTGNSFRGPDFISGRGRSILQFDRLLVLKAKRETFTVVDGLHVFTDMFFSNLQLIKEQEGFSVFFQADIQAIRKITIGTKQAAKVTRETALNRVIVSPATLLKVGATIERDTLETFNIAI